MKFTDRVTVRLISADVGSTLRAINERGIRLYDISAGKDAMTCAFAVRSADFSAIEAIAQRRGDAVTVISKSGAFRSVARLRKRSVLCAGLAIIFLLTMWLPTRVFFFRVSGNKSLPANAILSVAESCGVRFGMSRRALRSEKMKNALLESAPELQWAGINTAGCVATISVRERQTETKKGSVNTVSSLVAVRDGVISSITVERGSGLCAVGQAVKAGQVLISGYTDCGLTIRATQAQGEVYAETQRELTVIAPASGAQRGEQTAQTKKFALILGKNRINFYKGSGISHSSCVKMYSESYLTLPGGFQLPIGFVTETCVEYESTETVSATEDSTALEEFAKNYLSQQMVAGQILASRLESGVEEGFAYLRGEYACREMIGKVRNEESLDSYGN